MFLLQIAIEPFALFHYRFCDYTCFTDEIGLNIYFQAIVYLKKKKKKKKKKTDDKCRLKFGTESVKPGTTAAVLLLRAIATRVCLKTLFARAALTHQNLTHLPRIIGHQNAFNTYFASIFHFKLISPILLYNFGLQCRSGSDTAECSESLYFAQVHLSFKIENIFLLYMKYRSTKLTCGFHLYFLYS